MGSTPPLLTDKICLPPRDDQPFDQRSGFRDVLHAAGVVEAENDVEQFDLTAELQRDDQRADLRDLLAYLLKQQSVRK